MLLATALARPADPYHGCRAESVGEGIVLHRCPGVAVTESPAPDAAAPVVLASLRGHYASPTTTIADSTLTVDGNKLPALLLTGVTGRSLVAAAPVPGAGNRVLHCAASDMTDETLQRCAALIGRAATLGLGQPLPRAVGPVGPAVAPADALAAQAPPPSADPSLPPAPSRGRVDQTGPTADGPRFRGRAVPEPPDCGWALTGEDVGVLTCPTATLTLGRIPVSDPTVALDNLTEKHVAAAKANGYAGRVKRIQGPCRVDLLDAACVDLRLSPPGSEPYRLLVGAVSERGTTWFATCEQRPPMPGIPAPCDRLLSSWPPPGVRD
jgi:hypothetical protein